MFQPTTSDLEGGTTTTDDLKSEKGEESKRVDAKKGHHVKAAKSDQTTSDYET